MDREFQQWIINHVSQTSGQLVSVGGGSINETFRIECPTGKFFCKINSVDDFPGMFQTEKNGLAFLKMANAIRVPEVIWCGECQNKQVLILEWIEQGMKTSSFWKKFGGGLARLHLSSGDGHKTYGFQEDNYMGALSQMNTRHDDWVTFFIDCRLQPQLKLAENNGMVSKKDFALFEQLYKKLDIIFPKETVCALHGDLWSGNYLCDEHSEPVLIDPAVYYGHRSIDLGMTRLFGGFDREFYDAYHYHFPLPNNFYEQADVCNLYPLLIHLNLFGSGYLSSIHSILKRYA